MLRNRRSRRSPCLRNTQAFGPCCAPAWKASLPRSPDEGESVVYTRFYAEAQSALTEHLIGLNQGQSVSDSLIDEIIACAFSGLYNDLLLEADDH